MAAVFPLLLLLLLLHPLLSFAVIPPEAVPEAEAMALHMFKDSFTSSSSLSSWIPGTTPCNPKSQWVGVVCFHGIVTGLRLANMGLSGKIEVYSLTHLKSLRSVSFNNNSFSGDIPPFNKLNALKSIYLSDNQFSGDIPDDYFSNMDHLKKLWLSGNAFTGTIPSSLSKAPHLMELHLDDNRFTGVIPPLVLPNLKSFNVSANDLEGKIPSSFNRWNTSSFAGNEGLCGMQFGSKPCTVSSGTREFESRKVLIVCMVLVLLLCVVIGAAAAAKKRQQKGEFDTLGVDNREIEGGNGLCVPSGSSHKRHDSSNLRRQESSHKRLGGGGGGGDGGNGVGDLVVVNEEKGVFGLPDLMKAAAEVLGNGGLGSAYKAVMANGVAVVVKRLREMNRMGKEGFEVDMRRLGRLRHPNVLTPLAYHYRKEEKLVVLQFIEKGSLLYILHGDRGPDHAALDWPIRLKIIRGIARGMAYLHAELSSSDVPHGNLKSGNVLLGPDFEPLIVDFGFISLVNPSIASQTMSAYKSPETLQNRHLSPKCDVYCLGILILEILTGKFPSHYLNNTKGGTDVVQWTTKAISERRENEVLDPEISGTAEALMDDLVRLLRIGVACADPSPEKRLDMREVVARIEDGGVIDDAVPSLMDGYAESSSLGTSRASHVRDGNGEIFTLQSKSNNEHSLS